jgi:hypothetical protein
VDLNEHEYSDTREAEDYPDEIIPAAVLAEIDRQRATLDRQRCNFYTQIHPEHPYTTDGRNQFWCNGQ